MKCRELQSELPDFLRGRLDEAGVIRVSEHLSGCPKCRQEARAMEELFGIIRSDSWSPSGTYWASILPRVNSRLEKRSQLPQWTTRFALPLAAALILAVGFFRIAPRSGEDLPENFTAILHQLSDEEMQDVADQQAVADLIHPDMVPAEQAFSATDDVESVKEILQEEGGGTTDLDAGVATGMEETGSRDAEPAGVESQPTDSLN